jgi:hypothetical protein
MKKIILMLLAVTALTACSKFEQVDANDENGTPVELYGEISGATTRGAGVINAVPAGGLVFDLYRANQTGDPIAYGYYTTKVEGTLGADPDHLTKITTNPGLYYLPGGNYSSFIGLYPVGGSLAANQVTYDLVDGGTDILATQNVAVKEGENQPTVTLQFQHLLTKIQVKIKAKAGQDAEGIIATLGKITAIKVEGKAVKAIVTLPDLIDEPTDAAGARPTVTGGAEVGDGDLALVNTDGTSISDGIALDPAAAKTIGTAIFLPGTQSLKLKITAEESDDDAYTVTVPSYEYLQGSGYVITLALTIDKLGLVSFEFVSITGNIDAWTEVTTDGPADDEIELD